jgi:hypothetical protein
VAQLKEFIDILGSEGEILDLEVVAGVTEGTAGQLSTG